MICLLSGCLDNLSHNKLLAEATATVRQTDGRSTVDNHDSVDDGQVDEEIPSESDDDPSHVPGSSQAVSGPKPLCLFTTSTLRTTTYWTGLTSYAKSWNCAT